MKFDVIVGNPPYQLSDGGGIGSSAKPIYHKFIQQAKKLNSKFIIMIIPSRWFTGGKGLDEFRDEMIKDKRIKVLYDYINASDCFPSVFVEGGICYFLWDKDYQGKCNYFLHDSNGNIKQSYRLLNEVGDVFVRGEESIKILKKVKAIKENTFDSLVSSRNPYGFGSDFFKTDKSTLLDKRPKNGYKLLGVLNFKRCIKYLPSNYKIKLVEETKNWRVFISKADGAAGQIGNPIPARIIGKPILAEPYDLCTETFLRVGPFKSGKEANNAISYMTTKFFRLLVGIRKNKNMTQNTYLFAPIQNFSEPWTDEKLYKKYGLTKEEISFIETMVRPMDLTKKESVDE